MPPWRHQAITWSIVNQSPRPCGVIAYLTQFQDGGQIVGHNFGRILNENLLFHHWTSLLWVVSVRNYQLRSLAGVVYLEQTSHNLNQRRNRLQQLRVSMPQSYKNNDAYNDGDDDDNDDDDDDDGDGDDDHLMMMMMMMMMMMTMMIDYKVNFRVFTIHKLVWIFRLFFFYYSRQLRGDTMKGDWSWSTDWTTLLDLQVNSHAARASWQLLRGRSRGHNGATTGSVPERADSGSSRALPYPMWYHDPYQPVWRDPGTFE